MNKEIIEKMFDEQFGEGFEILRYGIGGVGAKYSNKEIKDFVLNTIIPEVIKELIVKEKELKKENENEDRFYCYGYNNCIKIIKQKAKENFGIDL